MNNLEYDLIPSLGTAYHAVISDHLTLRLISRVIPFKLPRRQSLYNNPVLIQIHGIIRNQFDATQRIEETT